MATTPTEEGPARRRQRREGERDQDPSIFTQILRHLVRTLPGAKAAVLVDKDGEAVDYAGALDAFDLKITAAHWQIVLSGIELGPDHGAVRQIVVRARGRGYLVRQIHKSYTVVVVLHARAAFAASLRALEEADLRLCAEAGFALPKASARWFSVDVQTEPRDRARPVRVRVAEAWQPVEVMGCMVGLRPRERGFRVRITNGAELLLVREPSGKWFADERIER